MLKLNLKALVIDITSATADELEDAYSSEFTFESIESVNTVLKAIQFLMTAEFNICFIGETFAQADVQSFFNDYKKLNKEYGCVFVQARSKVDLDFDRSSLQSLGFHTVISKVGDHRDKSALWDAVKIIIERKEHEDTVNSLDTIIDNLTEEIDKVALERKRGAKTRLSTIYANYLRESAGRFKGLADEFYHRLFDTTEECTPFAHTEVNIPDDVLKKNLPHLHKDTYKGQSHRVWGKLLNKHGVTDKPKDPEPVESPEDVETD